MEQEQIPLIYIRTAKRTQMAQGRIYAECPKCGKMVMLFPDRICSCGNVQFHATETTRLECTGGKEPLKLYRIDPAYLAKQESEDQVEFLDEVAKCIDHRNKELENIRMMRQQKKKTTKSSGKPAKETKPPEPKTNKNGTPVFRWK